MLLTLGAAGVTLLAMLAVIGVPAIDACRGNDRGLVQCLRGLVDDKFDLGIDPPPAAQPEAMPAAKPVLAEAPAPVDTAPRIQIADTPPVKATAETTRSLVPQVAEKPAAPDVAPPQVITAPKVVPAPDPAPEPLPVAELPAPEEPETPPAETIALASIVEPAPAFVPPAPLVAVDGVPPDLQVAMVEPAPVALPEVAPDFVLPATPDLPVAPPPDLTLAAPEPAETSAADVQSFVPPAPLVTVDGVPPDLQVARVEPVSVAPLAPALPNQPTAPPPDLTVAAVDPVVPAEVAPPEVPVLAPSIDAVEIDGDGNFIAGNGPAGANMRLYVDGIPVGVSPVEGGRWLVEGTDLLTEEQQTLKVEALDPLTGKVIGEATIIFEGPVSAEPEAPVEEEVTTPAVESLAGEPEAAIEPEAVVPTEVPAEDGAARVDAPAEQAVAPAEEAAIEPNPLPQITPVVPTGESNSVTILGSSGDSSITTLTTGKPSSDAVVTLSTTPAAPAVIASFTLPPAAIADTTVLRAMPVGDPGAGRFVSGKAIIRRGDTLWDIAHRYYGRGIHYRTIFRANRELIVRPGNIYPGQVFELPLVYDD